MATEEARSEFILGRSSSRGSQADSLPRSDSFQRADVRRKGKKGYGYGNDLFLCFAPRSSLHLVSRPAHSHSPSRDGRSRAQQHHAFSRFHKGLKKHSYEASPEPTSPKVTCIGQVRVKQKPAEAGPSASFPPPASRRLRWVPFSWSYKTCSKLTTELSCLFRLPCDAHHGSMPAGSSSSSSKGGSCCKAVFSRSLLLIQDHKKAGEALKDSSCFGDGSCRECGFDLLAEPVVEKEEEEDNAKEEEACHETEGGEMQPPPNSLLLTGWEAAEPVATDALTRSSSAPSCSRTGGGEMPDRDEDCGQAKPGPPSGESALRRSKSDCTGVAGAAADAITRPADSNETLLPLLTMARGVKPDSESEEGRKPEADGRVCSSPPARIEAPNQNLERENTDLDGCAPPLSTTTAGSASEESKLLVDMVPETWNWQGCSDLEPSEDSGRDCGIPPGAGPGSGEPAVEEGPAAEHGQEAASVGRGQQQADSEIESCERDETPDANETWDIETNAVIFQLEEGLCPLLPDRDEHGSVGVAPPDPTILALSYHVEALRLSVDAAFEMLAGGDNTGRRMPKQEREPLAPSGNAAPPCSMIVKEGSHGYRRSVLQCGSRQAKTFRPPHSFQLQRCKSEPVRLAV